MATRKLTLTIPDTLAARLDAYPGNLKLSAFMQEKLTEFLDAEDAKTTALLKEQQILDIRAVRLAMNGEYATARKAGHKAALAWAKTLLPGQLVEAYTKTSLHPYPLELGRPELLPKSLLTDDPRIELYVPTMLGREIMNAFKSSPEPVFMLSADRKDETLIWVYGWNEAVSDAYQEQRESENDLGGRSKPASKQKHGPRKRPPK